MPSPNGVSWTTTLANSFKNRDATNISSTFASTAAANDSSESKSRLFSCIRDSSSHNQGDGQNPNQPERNFPWNPQENNLTSSANSQWSEPVSVFSFHKFLETIWSSHIYFFVMFVATFTLLFGQIIQDTTLPKSADVIMDGVYLLVLAILLADVVINSFILPGYFKFHCYCFGRKIGFTPTEDMDSTLGRHFVFGSFFFWFDLLTSLVIITDMTFFTRFHNLPTYTFHLNEFGIPTDFSQYNPYKMVSCEEVTINLILSTMRAAKISRFVSAKEVVKVSNEVSLYIAGLIGSDDPYSNRSFLRFSRGKTEALQKQAAAIKIQHWWRKILWLGVSQEKKTRRKSRFSFMKKTSRRRQLPKESKTRSHVGRKMIEKTSHRVALFLLFSLIVTILFTYYEKNARNPMSMIMLHKQTQNKKYREIALENARRCCIPKLYEYTFSDGNSTKYDFILSTRTGLRIEDLREKEKQKFIVLDVNNNRTEGMFANKVDTWSKCVTELLALIFFLVLWVISVSCFSGPIMTLVVTPIERMIHLLAMLMKDPLGYQNTMAYRKFMDDDDKITKNTMWTKEVLDGMETTFLMCTILRIGNLLKVGFGSAGAEIIRHSLQSGTNTDLLKLDSVGSNVYCIFLFCDIRQFTDATECLQEEVFVFVNRIGSVVHSICNSYGGSANKNVGDAFLLSWQLKESEMARRDPNRHVEGRRRSSASTTRSVPTHKKALSGFDKFAQVMNVLKYHDKADKALLSVIKICIALHHDKYFIDEMSEAARNRLLDKLSGRPGPVVQIGFGLNAGYAVQGAIGSQRKIDPSYVAEAVEFSEYLESSTKKYGVKMLLSNSFYQLLNPSNRRRCRKVDQILIEENDHGDADYGDYIDPSQIMDLYTFDIDVDALWSYIKSPSTDSSDTNSDTGSTRSLRRGSRSRDGSKRSSMRISRTSLNKLNLFSTGSIQRNMDNNSGHTDSGSERSNEEINGEKLAPKLIIPNGPVIHSLADWTTDDMRKMRHKYVSNTLFGERFSAGLNAYYAQDWEHARQCFLTVLGMYEDGPSRYFYDQIEKYNGMPPPNFKPYGTV